MKKNLLGSLLLLGGLLLASAPNALAEKTYHQVTESSLLGHGGNFVVAAFATNGTSSYLRPFRNSNNGTAVVCDQDVTGTAFTSDMVWTMNAADSHACQNTNANHIDGHVFTLKQGDNYMVQNVSGAALSTTLVDNAYIELLQRDKTVGSVTYNLFNMHCVWSSNVFTKVRAVNNGGTINQYSNDTGGATNLNGYQYNFMDPSGYTAYFKVFLEFDSENPQTTAKVFWGRTYDRVIAEGGFANDAIADAVAAITFPADYTWTATTYEALETEVQNKWNEAYTAALATRDYEKNYVAITNINQLGDGGKYLIATVGTNSAFPLYYSATSTTGVELPADGTVDSALVWTLHRSNSAKCNAVAAVNGTNNGSFVHVSGPIFTWEHEGKYAKFTTANNVNSFTTTTTSDFSNEIEFINSQYSNQTGIEGRIFTLHSRRGSATGDFQTSYGWASNKTTLSGFTGAWDLINFGTNPIYSTDHNLFIEIDTQHPEHAAAALWEGLRNEAAEAAAEANKPMILALELPADVEWHNDAQLLTQVADKWAEALSAAVTADKTHLLAILAPIEGGVAGIWTAEEVAAAKTALTAYDVTDATKDSSTKLNEMLDIMNTLIEKVDGKNAMFKFNRSGHYLRSMGNGVAALAQAKMDPEALWQIKHVSDLDFRLYNAATNCYLADGNATTSTDGNTIYNFEHKDDNTFLIRNIGKTGNQYLHQSRAEGTDGVENNYEGLMWWTNNDAGSYFVAAVDEEAILNAIKNDCGTALVDYIGQNYGTGAGQYSAACLADLNAAVDAVTRADLTPENITATLTNLGNKVMNLYYSYGPDHMVFQIKDNGDVYLHYAAPVSNRTNYANSNVANGNDLFYYEDGKFLSYSDGMYMVLLSHTGSNKFPIFCSAATNNISDELIFVQGTTEGTYQMVMWQERGFHSSVNGTSKQINCCGVSANRNMPFYRQNNYQQTTEQEHNWTIEPVTSLAIAPANADGWGSYHFPVATIVPSITGAKFYLVSESEGEVKLDEVKGGTSIPARSIVMFNVGDYTGALEAVVDLNNTEVAAHSDMVHATHIAEPIPAREGYSTYKLVASGRGLAARSADVTVTLQKVTDTAKPLNEVLVTAPTDHSDVEADGDQNTFTLNVTRATSGISNIQTIEPSNTVYDLQGRRLAAPAKGINIIGGRKVLVK